MKDYRIENIESFLNLCRAKDAPALWTKLATDADKRIRQCVAGRKDASPEALNILAEDPEVSVRRQLSRNPNTSSETLGKLAMDSDLKVRTGVASHRESPTGVLKMLADEGESQLNIFISQNTNTSASVLSGYAADLNQLVRRNTVSHPSLNRDALWKFANDPSDEVRRMVFTRLSRLGETEKVITYFIGDRNEHIRGDIAADKHTPAKALQLLSDDEHYWVRRQVALNPNSTEETLERLSRDKEVQVRHAVALVATANSDRLFRLSKDKEDHVRSGVAGNASTPYEILKFLASDDSKWVREAVAKSQSLGIEDIEKFFGTAPVDASVSDILRNRHFNARRVIAEDPSTSSDTLVEMARCDFDDVHTHLAENPSLPVEAMESLSMRRSLPVILRLLRRCDIPESLSTELMRDREVRRCLVSLQSTPPEVLRKLFSTESDAGVIAGLARNAKVTPNYLVLLEDHADDLIRMNVASNPRAAPETLTRLSSDKVEAVRKATAANPSTPAGVLENLTEDKSEAVRLSLSGNRKLTENAIRKLAADPSKAIRRSLVLSILALQ